MHCWLGFQSRMALLMSVIASVVVTDTVKQSSVVVLSASLTEQKAQLLQRDCMV